MNYEELKTKISAAVAGVELTIIRESLWIKNPADLPKVAQFLKDSEEYKMDYLSSVTATDYLKHLESIYHLYSMSKKIGPLTLRVRTNREDPKIPSLVSIYRGAEFQERENYDMYGIHYEGHPDLRRIFMWDGFEGFPLRKDYEQEDSETLEMADVEWLEKRGIQVPDNDRKKAEELKDQGKRAIASKELTDKPGA